MHEEEFLAGMVAHPNNPEPRLLMADWLEERGDPRAELLRIQEQLRSVDVPNRKDVEARMQQLLREGVQPVVPRMTNSLGMSFLLIFPGEFMMGNEARKKQRRQQITDGFWLGETVVTQGQWRSVMQTEPWQDGEFKQQHPDCPATHVTGEDATEFCRHLSARTNRTSEHYTLPTEPQWEYACRAGTTTRFSFGEDEAELERYAWFTENTGDAGKEYAQCVGKKSANPWGLFDMHGNVWEWCQDTLYAIGSYRPRGGSWSYAARYCHSSDRDWDDPWDHDGSFGFRVALVPSREPSTNEQETIATYLRQF